LDDSGAARITICCTITLSGVTWDGGGATVSQCSGNPLGDGSQAESQSPFFKLNNATLRNCTIGAPAADGIHFIGGTSTVSSVRCPDIGEDIISGKGPGTWTVSSCTFSGGEDKIFQINDLCTITESSVNASAASKFMRQNGGKTWKMTSHCDSCTINNLSECVFRSDSSSSIFYYHALSTNCGTIGYPGTNVQAD
jgi:pectate lyase C